MSKVIKNVIKMLSKAINSAKQFEKQSQTSVFIGTIPHQFLIENSIITRKKIAEFCGVAYSTAAGWVCYDPSIETIVDSKGYKQAIANVQNARRLHELMIKAK